MTDIRGRSHKELYRWFDLNHILLRSAPRRQRLRQIETETQCRNSGFVQALESPDSISSLILPSRSQ